jgi:hypothetical protein
LRPKPRYSHSVHDCHTYAVTHPHRTSASLPFRPDTERGYNVRDTENDLDVVFSSEGARSRFSCPQSLSRYIADSACADGSILNNLASRSAAAGSAGEQVLGRLGGGTRLSTLAPHPTIDASTRGRGRIAHRSAELGYGRTAVDVVWIRDEKCPFMPAKASPNHKLDALVDHEVRSGCCGTDVAAGSTQTRRQRYRRTG